MMADGIRDGAGISYSVLATFALGTAAGDLTASSSATSSAGGVITTSMCPTPTWSAHPPSQGAES